MTVVIPPGSFVQKKTKYAYKDKKTGIKMKIDQLKKLWTLSVPKVSLWGKTSPHNGIDIYLNIRNSQGAITIYPQHSTKLKYKEK